MVQRPKSDENASRDLAAVRQVRLVEHLGGAGHAKVEDLAQLLGVTPQTIRGDLRQLDEQGAVSRVRGGAMLRSRLDNIGYHSRQAMAADAKGRIGKAAADLVPDGVSLFIGRLRAEDRAVVGPLTVDFLGAFKVDYAVIGASALDADGNLLDFDIDEIKVSQSIVAHARHVVLVADSSKLSRHAPVRFATMNDVDTFVTDRITDPRLAQICAEMGVRVIATDPA